MKFNQAIAVCKSVKKIRLYDVPNKEGVVNQWLGNGYAAYPMNNLPYMEMSNILDLFDLSGKALEKWSYIHAYTQETIETGLDFTDPSTKDVELKPFALTVEYGGRSLLPLYERSEKKVIFIGEELLKPIGCDFEIITYHERKKPDGTSYIIASAGMLISAIIMPATTWKNDFFADQLRSLSDIVCKMQELEGEKWKHNME